MTNADGGAPVAAPALPAPVERAKLWGAALLVLVGLVGPVLSAGGAWIGYSITSAVRQAQVDATLAALERAVAGERTARGSEIEDVRRDYERDLARAIERGQEARRVGDAARVAADTAITEAIRDMQREMRTILADVSWTRGTLEQLTGRQAPRGRGMDGEGEAAEPRQEPVALPMLRPGWPGAPVIVTPAPWHSAIQPRLAQQVGR